MNIFGIVALNEPYSLIRSPWSRGTTRGRASLYFEESLNIWSSRLECCIEEWNGIVLALCTDRVTGPVTDKIYSKT